MNKVTKPQLVDSGFVSSCHEQGINTSCLTDLYIGFTLKMESLSKNTIFDIKMMVKSSVEKVILKSLHAGR